ncbi:sulfotransferase domain-containing protein [Vampirovibrio sp.]|uniref:sulfotransferase domain-containing protein n=1 Tax=Vampirovibrio sp. TaxID=2717857 RepID=UPI003593568D
MEKEIIIHVGMHKTGTTYLQEHIFPKLDDVYLVSVNTVVDPIKRFLKHLFSRNVLLLDLGQIKVEIEAFIESLPQNKILISNESLFGFFHENYSHNKMFADYLKLMFPNAKILVTIRRQDDWLESAYKQVIHAGLSISINHFLNYFDGRFHSYASSAYKEGPNIDVRTLELGRFIQNYQHLFSPQNVLVLPFEMLRNEPSRFLSTFYDFAKIKPYFPQSKKMSNRGYSLISAYLALGFNRLTFLGRGTRKKLLRPLLERTIDRWFYIKHQFIKPNIRAEIMKIHQNHNRELAQLTGLNLQQYGYYVETR